MFKKSFSPSWIGSQLAGLGAVALVSVALGPASASAQTWLLPFETQTRETAVESYRKALSDSQFLKVQARGDLTVEGLESVQTVIARPKTEKPRILVLANDTKDLVDASSTLNKYAAELTTAGAEVLVLPPAAFVSSGAKTRSRLQTELLKSVDAVVSLSGDDISPHIYGRYNSHSVSTNPERDDFEAEILRRALGMPHLFLLGVGRGHQLLGALHGHALNQDIEAHLSVSIDHGQSEHTVGLFKTNHNLVRILLPDLRNGQVVHSRHHQAVRPSVGSELAVAAVSEDGVIEALEFKDGRGLTLQFQPEELPASRAKRFFSLFVKVVGRHRDGQAQGSVNDGASGNSCVSALTSK
jgi:putative glutamine amidotransferase